MIDRNLLKSRIERRVAELKGHGGFSYASTQVNLPAPLSEVAKRAARLLPEEIVLRYEETPHVTVKYGIEADAAEAELRALVEGHAPLVMEFGIVDCFPAAETGAEEDVVVVRVESAALDRLHTAIGREVEVVHTFPYNPHVTLAYVKAGSGARFRAMDNPLTGRHWVARNVLFSDRAGNTTRLRLKGDEPDRKALGASIKSRFLELKNCGNGAGGFQEGNTCARGGGEAAAGGYTAITPTIGTPEPDPDNPAAGVKKFVVGPNAALRFGDIQEVEIEGLIATQDYINPEQVNKLLKQTEEELLSDDLKLPIIIAQNGKHYVGDGHHRVEALKAKGLTRIRRAIVVPLDASGNPTNSPKSV